MLSISIISIVNLLFLIFTLLFLGVFLVDRFYWKQYKDDEQDLLIKLSYELLPVLLIIMIIRTFVFEPFVIPSESMYPQLTEGDFIVVSKTSYGIKFPFSNVNMFDLNTPEAGDVAVFQYPLDVNTYFVKRVIGVPGDTIVWKDNDMFINGQRVERTKTVPSGLRDTWSVRYEWETINNKKHIIRKMTDNDAALFNVAYDFVKIRSDSILRDQGKDPEQFKNYLEIKIPPDYYFMMGDNREQSMDSRSWGLVHKNYFVGKVGYIIVHVNENVPFWNIFNKITFSRNAKVF